MSFAVYGQKISPKSITWYQNVPFEFFGPDSGSENDPKLQVF
jgi:hypothetical protein